MTQQEVKKIILNHLKDYQPISVGIFGSFARGESTEKSDIDILVGFNRDIDLFDFLDLREYLENRLHIKVDLVMESALKPAICKRILSEVEYV